MDLDRDNFVPCYASQGFSIGGLLPRNLMHYHEATVSPDGAGLHVPLGISWRHLSMDFSRPTILPKRTSHQRHNVPETAASSAVASVPPPSTLSHTCRPVPPLHSPLVPATCHLHARIATPGSLAALWQKRSPKAAQPRPRMPETYRQAD